MDDVGLMFIPVLLLHADDCQKLFSRLKLSPICVEDVRNLHKTLARMNFSNLIGVLAEFFKVDRSERTQRLFFLLNAEGNILCVCVFLMIMSLLGVGRTGWKFSRS